MPSEIPDCGFYALYLRNLVAGQPDGIEPFYLSQFSGDHIINLPGIKPLVKIHAQTQFRYPVELGDAVLVGKDVVVKKNHLLVLSKFLNVSMLSYLAFLLRNYAPWTGPDASPSQKPHRVVDAVEGIIRHDVFNGLVKTAQQPISGATLYRGMAEIGVIFIKCEYF